MVTRSPNHFDKTFFYFELHFEASSNLVGKFVGNNYGNVLLVTPGRLALLIQDGHLPVRDQPPVLHRPRAEVRDCNHVLLGQGE